MAFSQDRVCLDEWRGGIRTEIPFTYELFKETYGERFSALKVLTSQCLTRNVLHQLQHDLYNEGRRDTSSLISNMTASPFHESGGMSR
jgi:hypothetical protein